MSTETTKAVRDDRIATLIDELERKGSPYGVDTPAARRSTAISVAVLAIAPPPDSGRRYSSLLAIERQLRGGETPEELAAWIYDNALVDGIVRRYAVDAERVAEIVDGSSADLRDDGRTVSQWRAFAAACRSAVS